MLESMAGRRLFPLWPVALLLGIFSGWVYLRVGDAVLAAFLALAFSMALGAARPRHAWARALIISLCIPAAEVLAIVTHAHLTSDKLPGSFIALVPAFVGAYGGFFMRRAVGVLFQKPGN